MYEVKLEPWPELRVAAPHQRGRAEPPSSSSMTLISDGLIINKLVRAHHLLCKLLKGHATRMRGNISPKKIKSSIQNNTHR